MKHIVYDKYTIAWFKLADCIAKGEREKAFGVYRLLAHSLEDQAYAFKLEGDLLYAFQDGAAAEKYAQAASIYSQQKKYKEAAVLYEELIFLAPDNQAAHLRKLLDLYTTYAPPSFFIPRCVSLAEKLVLVEKIDLACVVVDSLNEHAEAFLPVYQKIVFFLLRTLAADSTALVSYLHKTLDVLKDHDDAFRLSSFLTSLEATNRYWYEQACAYLGRTF